MISANGHYHACIELARAHGFGRIVASNLAMKANTLFFMNQNEAAAAEYRAAIELAVKARQPRAEMLALAEAGRCDEAAAVQKQVVAEAEKAEDLELAARLKEDLMRYEKGAPCRPTAGDVSAQQPKDPPVPATKADKSSTSKPESQENDPPVKIDSQDPKHETSIDE